MKTSIKLFRIAGIDIGINYSWILIFGLISWSLAQGYFPQTYPGWAVATYWITGVVSALLLFTSVLLHELAHSLIAKVRGLSVSSITLFIFGGVSNLEKEPQSPSVEFYMALAGPLCSLILGSIFWGLSHLPEQSTPISATLQYLGFINVLLAAFNLLPGFPLDGGRVLRSIIWGVTNNLNKATTIASIVGQGFGWVLIIFGVFSLFTGDFLGGIWIAFIGWFLTSAAEASRQQITLQEYLGKTKVKDIMNSKPIIVDPDTSVNETVTTVFYQGQGRSAPIMQEGKLLGIVTITDVKKLPHDRWGSTPVKAIMTQGQLYSVTPDDDLNTALELIIKHDVNQLLVLKLGLFVGLLSRQDIIRSIQISQELNTK